MKTKRNIIAIISSLLLLTVIGFAFAIIKHDKGEFVDNSSTTRSYVDNLDKTVGEIPDDFDFYTVARRQVITYFSEGITDKEKLIHSVLEILVSEIEIEGTEYDITPQQEQWCKESHDRAYKSNLYMKDLIESKGLDYDEFILSRCQARYSFELLRCMMNKWFGHVGGTAASGSEASSGFSGSSEEMLAQYYELQDKKIEQLHKKLNRKYDFDDKIEELFVEFFGENYEQNTYDAWFLEAQEQHNKEVSASAAEAAQTTIRYVETTTSLDDRFGTVFPTRERGYETKTQSAD